MSRAKTSSILPVVAGALAMAGVLLVVLCIVLATGHSPFAENRSGAPTVSGQQQDGLRPYLLSVIGSNGEELLPPMEIDNRPLTRNANGMVALHKDSSLPAFFQRDDALGLPDTVTQKPVVLVAHTAASGVVTGYGPFTFMSNLQLGSQNRGEIIRISGGPLISDVVCRVQDVEKGPAALPSSVYLDAAPNTVLLITCALTPEGTIDEVHSTRMTSTCSGT